MGDISVLTHFGVCWGTSLKMRDLAGNFHFTCPLAQTKGHLWAAGQHRHFLPNTLAMHNVHKFSGGLTDSKPVNFSSKLTEIFVKLHMHHMQLPGTQLRQCTMPRQLAAPAHIAEPCSVVSSHCQAESPASHPQPHWCADPAVTLLEGIQHSTNSSEKIFLVKMLPQSQFLKQACPLKAGLSGSH